MTKSIDVSDDSGSTWFTLPGGQGSISRQAGQIDDTIFGQSFQSNEAGLIDWSIKGQAYYKGFAGYKCDLKKQGSSTAFTTEACTLVSGKTYKITDTTKNLWDRATALTVFDNAIDHTADVVSINWLWGEVTFDAAYTVTTPVTVSGNYFPTAAMGKAQSYTLTQQSAVIDTTTFDSAQANGGYLTRDPGLRTVTLDVDNVYALASGFAAALVARSEWVIEINPDGNGKSRARGFFRLIQDDQSGNVGALEQESISFALNVPAPDSLTEVPFQWRHANDTTLSTAVKMIVDAWQNETKLDGRYTEDGVTGNTGQVVVSECSMSGSLDGMNEFSVTLMGDGTITAY